MCIYADYIQLVYADESKDAEIQEFQNAKGVLRPTSLRIHATLTDASTANQDGEHHFTISPGS